MGLIVQKFGGSSVADADKIRNVARIITETYRRGHNVLAVLSAQGGCEPQVKAHVGGNAAVGNGKETLLAALTLCMPYIGFPRTLNALGCINAVLPEAEG